MKIFILIAVFLTSIFASAALEKGYIKTIKICVDPNQMPLEKIDKDGNYIGIISDYAIFLISFKAV